MTFHTHIAGIPCLCEVTHYSAARPMRITGTGFGDAEPPEPVEFEFRILDRRGRLAEWLERKVTQSDEARLLAEYRAEESGAA
ncbi:hypothetical protein [Halomonas elongata]|uniref:Homolog to phage YuA protein gp49 n=1 Tax=Halomonas elongata (strain ATCC 33173 / DSM 2581 / NBRC 15536 / NCIMB 2198 / 1H9) TaxID=768066 RepID=A0A1R4A4C2_HALED|nr:hypothetical protein [Halomonas elongata]WPU48702.1 hypothetical protein SR933_07370 [Halomonas elongata DSM 2581]SJK83809.1 homolog to phage YuA protein gp49 [Halomonas elongata DSM 2581]